MVVPQIPWLTPSLFPNFLTFDQSQLSCKEQKGHITAAEKEIRGWMRTLERSGCSQVLNLLLLQPFPLLSPEKDWDQGTEAWEETASSLGHRCLFNKDTDELRLKKENQYFCNERHHQEIPKKQHCSAAGNWIISSAAHSSALLPAGRE